MALIYYLDFTAHIPQKQCPDRNELVRFLNQEVKDLPRGNILIEEKPGVFKVKVYDREKGAQLENRTLTYILPGDINGKKPVKIKFEKRAKSNLVKPRYVTITNLHNSELGDHMTNEELTEFFQKFGQVINPVADVYATYDSVWTLDKKRLFMDLNKGKDIPRINPMEIKVNGETIRGQIRVTYRDQPYLCKRCGDDHTALCPKIEEEKHRSAVIKNMKNEKNKTIIVGDSNLKLINGESILADVVSSSGAKIGHISNIISEENLDSYDNIVVMAGTNNIPPAHENYTENAIFDQVKTETTNLCSKLDPYVTKGKNVLMVHVPNSPHCRQSQTSLQLRNRINKHITEAVNKLNNKSTGRNKVDKIEWAEKVNDADFGSVKGISEKLTAELLGKIDTSLNNAMAAPFLPLQKTAFQYSKVSPAYPVGCYKCTAIGHSMEVCKANFNVMKRSLSNKDENVPASKK